MDLLDLPQNATIMLVRCRIINTAGRELLWRSTTRLKARWYEIVITLALLNLKLEGIAEVRALGAFAPVGAIRGKRSKLLAWPINSIRDSGGNYDHNFQKFSC